jgi:hypothetical protein
MAARIPYTGGTILMLRIEAFPGKFLIEICIGMLVDFDHNRVSFAFVAFTPIVAIRYAAFHVRHFIHPHASRIPFRRSL